MIIATHNMKRVRQLLLTFVSVSFLGFCLVFFTCLITGKCNLRIDASIIEAGICLEQEQYQPVLTVPLNTERIYVCGQIEGTTRRPGRLHVFYKGKVIFSEHFEEAPGPFFHVLPIPLTLTGSYRVEIGYAKRELANVEFTVIEQ